MNDQNPTRSPSTPPLEDCEGREKPDEKRPVHPEEQMHLMNRRDFLRIASITTAVVVIGAGGFTVAKKLTQNQVDAIKTAVAKILAKRYGDTNGKMLDQKVQQELGVALDQLPYIGTSEENKWADNMPSAALALATYRVLVPEYATLEEVGHILYEALQNTMNGLPSLIMKVTYNEEAIIEKLKALAARSQKRQYPEDWVMTFVEGTGQDFTYGLDVTECAIQKYLTAQGATELTRYLCLTDYVSSEAMGRGLVRYKTLAEGCALCDFRYKKGRPSYLYPLRDGWPPRFADS